MTELIQPTTGQPAPPISLPDAEGRQWRLSDQIGRNVILIFHRHIH